MDPTDFENIPIGVEEQEVLRNLVFHYVSNVHALFSALLPSLTFVKRSEDGYEALRSLFEIG